MSTILFITLLCIAVVVCWKTRSIFHPSFITSCIWLIVICAYNTLNHGLYPISNKFYYALALWTIPFCMSSYFFSRVKLKIPPALAYRTINPNYVSLTSVCLYIIILICAIGVQYTLGGASTVNILAGMRELNLSEDLPLHYKVITYLEVPIYVIFWAILFFGSKLHKRYVVYLGLLLVVFTFLNATKGKLLELFLAFVFYGIYTKRLKLKWLLLMAGCLIPMIGALSLLRDGVDSMDFIELLIIYILSPITALDIALQFGPFEPSLDGSHTFRLFYTLQELLVGSQPPNNGNAITGWVNVPLPTNVYTIMYNYYLDWGYKGIAIMGTLLGAFWGTLFNLVKKGVRVCVIAFALLYYNLVFQFFGDWLLFLLSQTLQILFFSTFIFLRFKSTKYAQEH